MEKTWRQTISLMTGPVFGSHWRRWHQSPTGNTSGIEVATPPAFHMGPAGLPQKPRKEYYINWLSLFSKRLTIFNYMQHWSSLKRWRHNTSCKLGINNVEFFLQRQYSIQRTKFWKTFPLFILF